MCIKCENFCRLASHSKYFVKVKRVKSIKYKKCSYKSNKEIYDDDNLKFNEMKNHKWKILTICLLLFLRE